MVFRHSYVVVLHVQTRKLHKLNYKCHIKLSFKGILLFGLCNLVLHHLNPSHTTGGLTLVIGIGQNAPVLQHPSTAVQVLYLTL